MELHTIDMDRAEARRRYIEYRDAVRERHDAEMAEIMRGYRALAQGHQVIDLAATIRAGGEVSVVRTGWREGRRTSWSVEVPALAVMRADQEWCFVAVDQEGRVRYFNDRREPRWNTTRNVVRLPAGTATAGRDWSVRPRFDFRAMVPPVPPRFLPAHGLGNYHVLWEAEWEACPPVDPALLKHIGGDLYAVLATWDLTELERTVLARRFR